MARLFVIDTETGGIDPQAHSILSLAGVVWNDGRIEAELDLKIAEPTFSVTAQALGVNRINLVDHAAGAFSPGEAGKQLSAFLRKHFSEELKSGAKVALAGHNVGFDIGFLRRLCRLGDVPFNDLFSHRSLDTSGILRFMSLAGRAPLQGAGLEEALQHFQIVVPGDLRHTALGDARGTAELLSNLIALQRAPVVAPVVMLAPAKVSGARTRTDTKIRASKTRAPKTPLQQKAGAKKKAVKARATDDARRAAAG